MKPAVILLALLILIGCGDDSEMRVQRECSSFKGVAYLAFLHPEFPVEKAVQVYQDIDCPALAVLWGTFGKRWMNIAHFIESQREKPHLVHVYLSNHTCLRLGRRCLDGELRPGASAKDWERWLKNRDKTFRNDFLTRATTIRLFLEGVAAPTTQFSIAVGLEDQLTRESLAVAVLWLREVWPYAIVTNPVRGANRTKHALLETHRDTRGDYYSNDGRDLLFPHRPPRLRQTITPEEMGVILDTYQERRATFIWSAAHQGLIGDVQESPPPMDRVFYVSDSDIEFMNYLLRRPIQ